MKKLFLLLLIAAFFASGCVRDKITDFRLNAMAAELNKQCPMQVDVMTILVNVKVLPNRVLKYNYKLKAGVNFSDSTIAQRVFRRKIIYILRNNPSMKVLTDMEVTFVYDYASADGKHLFQMNVAPDEYKQRNGKGYLSDQKLAVLISDAAWSNRLSLPLTLDQYTVWTDSQFAAPDTLVMDYEVDGSLLNMENFSLSTLKETLVKNTRSDKSAQELKDKGCIFKHVYRVRKEAGFQVIITPADYK